MCREEAGESRTANMCDGRHTITICSQTDRMNSLQTMNKPGLGLIRGSAPAGPGSTPRSRTRCSSGSRPAELEPTLRLRVARSSSPSESRTRTARAFHAPSPPRARPGSVPVLQSWPAAGRPSSTRGPSRSPATPEERPTRGTRRALRADRRVAGLGLGRLGVDARVGEVPGEYCPGAFSVNARGRIKLAGVGQRLISGRPPRRGRGGARQRGGPRRPDPGLRRARTRLGPRDDRERRGRGPGRPG